MRKNKQKEREYQKSWRAKHPEYHKNYYRKLKEKQPESKQISLLDRIKKVFLKNSL